MNIALYKGKPDKEIRENIALFQKEKSMDSLKESPFLIRELIHDLMLTLTSTMIHLDSLILSMDNNSHNYIEVLQANEQMERALSFFMQLRSIYLYETNILT